MLDLKPETEKAILERAEALGVSPDEVVRSALGVASPMPPERQETPEERAARRMAAVDATIARYQARPILDHRPIQEIVDEINDL